MVGLARLTSIVGFTGISSTKNQIQTQQPPIPPQSLTTRNKLIYKSTYPCSRTLLFVAQEASSLNGEVDKIPASSSTNRIESVQESLSDAFSDNIDEKKPAVTATTPAIATVSSKPFVKKKLQTYLRYLEVECWKRSDLRGLESVLQAVASACKQITRIVQRAQTDDVYGVALDVHGNPLCDTNIQGEVQQKLDVLCNTIMLQAFCGSGRDIHAVASEEEDEPRCCSDVMVRYFGASFPFF